jgi:hypothetical protein
MMISDRATEWVARRDKIVLTDGAFAGVVRALALNRTDHISR